MSERDTHFAGFADLLYAEMDTIAQNLYNPNFITPGMQREIATIIARRAYDLVRHAIDSVAGGIYTQSYVGMGEDADIADVPDMTQWPDSSHE